MKIISEAAVRIIRFTSISVVCIIALAVIYNGVNRDFEDPIMSSIDNIPIQEVIFPAVSLNMDNNAAPWEFDMRVLNFLEIECTVQLSQYNENMTDSASQSTYLCHRGERAKLTENIFPVLYGVSKVILKRMRNLTFTNSFNIISTLSNDVEQIILNLMNKVGYEEAIEMILEKWAVIFVKAIQYGTILNSKLNSKSWIEEKLKAITEDILALDKISQLPINENFDISLTGQALYRKLYTINEIMTTSFERNPKVYLGDVLNNIPNSNFQQLVNFLKNKLELNDQFQDNFGSTASLFVKGPNIFS